jgi:hypothetical protein
MKNISKAALVTTLVVGATVLGSTSVSAFDGGMGQRSGGMVGEMRQGGEDKFHLVSEEMREEFRAEHMAEMENLTEEERIAEREEHRAERRAHRDERHQETADFVGVSTDELKEARETGVSMGELLTENGKTQEDAETFLTTQANEHVDSIVERHELDTQEEATIRGRVSEFVGSILSRWFN